MSGVSKFSPNYSPSTKLSNNQKILLLFFIVCGLIWPSDGRKHEIQVEQEDEDGLPLLEEEASNWASNIGQESPPEFDLQNVNDGIEDNVYGSDLDEVAQLITKLFPINLNFSRAFRCSNRIQASAKPRDLH